ncbi:hypothetical protein [Mycolicibacterium iranicum]|uniref:Transmembrane protein n=1 Tax=Mycolicibacterium iranicum TaxID=912594 RepID=A0A178M0C6_MYCIR|nr:hypothetical protein [Mycolicibacterium iranicum]OAN39856.1 hypothetical protein A4X20_15995 [Mycolicibacterium iranicum]
MQVFTNGFGVWLRRLTARNPLVRVSDRFEALVLLAVGAVMILTVPVAGAVGTATYDRLSETFAAERLVRQEVDATAVADSREDPEPYQTLYVTTVAWTYNGVTHTDDIRTGRINAGDTVVISVDGEGKRAARVPTDDDAAAQAVLAALGLWSAVVTAAVASWLLLRMRLNRLRFTAWDRELDDLADNGGRANNSAA